MANRNCGQGREKLRKKLRIFGLGLMGGILVTGLVWLLGREVQALPPPEDIPEEVARTEIITEARSPLDGSPVTAAEYAEQTAQLQTAPYPPIPPPTVPGSCSDLANPSPPPPLPTLDCSNSGEKISEWVVFGES